jgi:hypothetical protein
MPVTACVVPRVCALQVFANAQVATHGGGGYGRHRYACGMSAHDIFTTVTAAVALVVSCLTLGRQAWRDRRDRAEVSVSGGSAFWPLEKPGLYWKCWVTVTNVGQRAVTVMGAVWHCDIPDGSSIQLMARNAEQPFPFRMEPNDSRTWFVKVDAQGRAMVDVIGKPGVQLVQRPTRRESKRGVRAERFVYGSPSLMDRTEYEPF